MIPVETICTFFLFTLKESRYPRDSNRYFVSRVEACFMIKLKHRRQEGVARETVSLVTSLDYSVKEMLGNHLNAYFQSNTHLHY